MSQFSASQSSASDLLDVSSIWHMQAQFKLLSHQDRMAEVRDKEAVWEWADEFSRRIVCHCSFIFWPCVKLFAEKLFVDCWGGQCRCPDRRRSPIVHPVCLRSVCVICHFRLASNCPGLGHQHCGSLAGAPAWGNYPETLREVVNFWCIEFHCHRPCHCAFTCCCIFALRHASICALTGTLASVIAFGGSSYHSHCSAPTSTRSCFTSVGSPCTFAIHLSLWFCWLCRYQSFSH